jgi:hypothetical protein
MTPCHTTQVVGIILAVLSGVLIGSSFVFKKKGLLRSQAGHTAGEGVAYLKSVRNPLFPPSELSTTKTFTGIMVDWHDLCVVLSFPFLSVLTGVVMILGEFCNFAGALPASQIGLPSADFECFKAYALVEALVVVGHFSSLSHSPVQ